MRFDAFPRGSYKDRPLALQRIGMRRRQSSGILALPCPRAKRKKLGISIFCLAFALVRNLYHCRRRALEPCGLGRCACV